MVFLLNILYLAIYVLSLEALMRALLYIFLFGFLGYIAEGQFLVGAQNAVTFNPPLNIALKIASSTVRKAFLRAERKKCSQLKIKSAMRA